MGCGLCRRQHCRKEEAEKVAAQLKDLALGKVGGSVPHARGSHAMRQTDGRR